MQRLKQYVNEINHNLIIAHSIYTIGQRQFDDAHDIFHSKTSLQLLGISTRTTLFKPDDQHEVLF